MNKHERLDVGKERVWRNADTDTPPNYKWVEVKYQDGSTGTAKYVDDSNRARWISVYGGGLWADLAWSGKFVKYWRER